MQRVATILFIAASIIFGVVGVLMVTTTPGDEQPATWEPKLLAAVGFVVLSSFAVSVAFKYLDGNKS